MEPKIENKGEFQHQIDEPVSQYAQNEQDQNQHPVNIKQSNELHLDSNQNENDNSYIQFKIRNGFIKKVFGIVFSQLIFTILSILFFQTKIAKNFVTKHENFFVFSIITSSITFLVVYFILLCNRQLARKVPYNYFILFIITFCETVICSTVAMAYSFEIVLISLLLTATSVIAIISYAFTAKIDFSNFRMILSVIFGQLLMFGILCLFMRSEIMRIFYCLMGTIVVGMYLVYDVQLISGKVGMGYEVDDYIFASAELYIDIIRLFIDILRIVGKVMSKRN